MLSLGLGHGITGEEACKIVGACGGDSRTILAAPLYYSLQVTKSLPRSICFSPPPRETHGVTSLALQITPRTGNALTTSPHGKTTTYTGVVRGCFRPNEVRVGPAGAKARSMVRLGLSSVNLRCTRCEQQAERPRRWFTMGVGRFNASMSMLWGWKSIIGSGT